ncbi:MAG: hypothetical protein ABEJ65_08310, partial [bacterium]
KVLSKSGFTITHTHEEVVKRFVELSYHGGLNSQSNQSDSEAATMADGMNNMSDTSMKRLKGDTVLPGR